MKNDRKLRNLVIVAALSAAPWLGLSSQALGQTFSSGSTGVDGAFNPTTSTTITLPPSGVFNYTSVTIPAGVTITYARNATNTPVTILATGDVTINGTISVKGSDGVFGNGLGPFAGGLGGPGGFNGGNGGVKNGMLPSAGQGPGGGAPGAFPPAVAPRGGRYGAPSSFVALVPLFGGSGGGGGAASDNTGPVNVAASGGGGGGALLIASSGRIVVNGTGSISAIGGSATSANFGVGSCYPTGQPGSGGAIRLVATQILCGADC